MSANAAKRCSICGSPDAFPFEERHDYEKHEAHRAAAARRSALEKLGEAALTMLRDHDCGIATLEEALGFSVAEEPETTGHDRCGGGGCDRCA